MREYKAGRNPEADIILSANFCSRDHAKITITDDNRILLQDYSSNGTYVKGKKISQQSMEVKYGDEVLFANVEKLDWTKIEKPQIIASTPAPAPIFKPEIKIKEPIPPNRYWLYAGLIFVVLIVSGLIIHLANNNAHAKEVVVSPADIYNRYQSAVALVGVDYYIRIHTSAIDIYLGMNDSNEIDIKKTKGELKPLTSQGTAFYIDSSGMLITNRHVIVPWKHDRNLKNYFNSKIKPAIVRLYREKGYGNENPSYTGELEGIYIYPNGSNYSNGERISCAVHKESNNEEIDLASLQISSGVLPKGSKIINMADMETDARRIEVNTTSYVIGFPYGDELAVDEDHIVNCSSTQGSFTQKPSSSYVQYSAASASGASGSPVFNQYGKLVAVNYLGMTNGQSFNRGILAKYINMVR